ncbi:translation elongation factor 4 [Finegoldia magna]|jgi:GTP-binding protein lepA|uniref:translation elongation factor 4 n=1 Tax=Finegoldia magna TaxID=1260 RepID=UPI002909E96A|nr:translation elongation factor 4 [Finegoldia magna]MDU5200212.1 translation elongation factor 4 [Finegoldia magna]MDU5273509.1 translation elongation factor 4 [Finegoldia magna]MDU5507742.1 translation elongation factor 4 [Finegoldia magna]MDU5961275.1 translation elongation factor 4 [Finegoldia magna]MDU6775167.1 translation elongation factor 4 [Finegoldia magna]
MKHDKKYIRNFSIIAHIDHGKSTLADRLIEETGMLTHREMSEQVLDSMDLERERGITIKLKAIKLSYKAKDGNVYNLNLIDTPGHVDFTYEVSRSLKACEGAVLIVDATQGVEAQTLGNVYLAIDQNLEILPVINKIDLPSADIDFAKKEIEDIIGLDAENVPAVSAKEGINIVDVLEDIVNNVPAPIGDENKPLKALIFDSYYDFYKGVVVYVRVFDGCIKPGSEILMMSTNKSFEVTECGYTSSGMISTDEISAGDVGYVVCSIKNVKDARVGDTITDKNNPVDKPLEGYKRVTPMVYCGIYPAEGEDFNSVRDALEKLQVNDAALTFENETSIALGFGLRCGFLGLLHMEIIQERLDREFDLDIIATAPSVIYKVHKKDGTEVEIQNPTNFPKETEIDYVEEPVVNAEIMTPTDYVGVIMELCQGKRGTFIDMTYLDEKRVTIKYKLPLNEVIYDFYDALKSKTRGYASLDYELIGYEKSDLIKLEIMINSEKVDALTLIVHEDLAYERARKIVTKLKDEIPRHQFVIPVQAAIGNKIIARETIKAYRKDVLAKCYGGDITRKRKLLEKQKEGKKRMRSVGSVDVPQEAFLSVLKYDEGN